MIFFLEGDAVDDEPEAAGLFGRGLRHARF